MKGWMVAITWKVTCIINILGNLSGSLYGGVAVTHEKKGDTQISIRVDIIKACRVCKGKLCLVPSFHWCYYMAGCYHMADYTYEDTNKTTAAPA